ncbi:uracil-DNA glycosylase [Gudongella oleilytica]|jgi:uracil-DNA glycosylase|uniref:uracil-DNA glycosylase n=1 Tax=Gudongella oleilytica TaxID=1582259 RepID=UPI000ED5871C|nr:uracil-DNA glycosylase [Gudongella oleilytica]MDY0257324.1 uracil-DNA glycosylase [Gudongella oleilytica]HCO18502.1 uracil-DNA glycosylase [Tissierellales bacterium]
MKEIFKNSWQEILLPEMEKPYYKKLRQFLIEEYKTNTIYPDMYSIFNALHYTDYNDVKAVILGQDPYHGPNQAHGLSFSVKRGVPAPPSLVNIYKEMQDDLGFPIPNHGCLEKWAREGVLLLNTVLTVRKGEANSHRDKGWEQFTDHIIRLLNERDKPIVFILWGTPAIRKESMIDQTRHYVIKSPHPSPLSAYRGFFGSKPFSRANHFLEDNGVGPIDWRLDEDGGESR